MLKCQLEVEPTSKVAAIQPRVFLAYQRSVTDDVGIVNKNVAKKTEKLIDEREVRSGRNGIEFWKGASKQTATNWERDV